MSPDPQWDKGTCVDVFVTFSMKMIQTVLKVRQARDVPNDADINKIQTVDNCVSGSAKVQFGSKWENSL